MSAKSSLNIFTKASNEEEQDSANNTPLTSSPQEDSGHSTNNTSIPERPPNLRRKSFSSPDSLCASLYEDLDVSIAEGDLLFETSIGTWEKRYCILTPQGLYLSKGTKKPSERKKVKPIVYTNEIVAALHDRVTFLIDETCFRVVLRSNKKDLFFKAADLNDMEKWLDALIALCG